MLSIFSCAYWPSVHLLWKNVCLGLLHIFWLSWFFFCYWRSYLYVLEVDPLLVASFANIYSQSAGCLFTLFMVSFDVQKLLSSIRFHLFNFVFIFISLFHFISFGGRSKKTLLRFMSKECSMFSVKNFIVSSLTFRYLIHFEFIFVYGVR